MASSNVALWEEAWAIVLHGSGAVVVIVVVVGHAFAEKHVQADGGVGTWAMGRKQALARPCAGGVAAAAEAYLERVDPSATAGAEARTAGIELVWRELLRSAVIYAAACWLAENFPASIHSTR